jgi:16S rRNA G966 N2-methylase RsmD
VAAVLAAGAPTPVDLVLADPPYDVTTDNVQAVLTALPDGKWVRPGSVVVIERPVSAPELVWPDDWTPWPPRRYGDTRLEAAEFG